MAIESVGSSSASYQTLSSQGSEAKQAGEARRAAQESAREAAQLPPEQTGGPRPVTNAEGQTTGTRVNVTA